LIFWLPQDPNTFLPKSMISLLSAGLHTCDQRRSKQSISNDFPIVEFENGFNDHDLLWTKDFQVCRTSVTCQCHHPIFAHLW
jgi:hypothetical protein